MLVSDEAPEATCLSSLCGSFRRLVRRLFPLHASLWQGGDGPRDCSQRMTGRGSGCGVMRDDTSAWPVAREVPAGWCTIPTGTLARGMLFDHWRPAIIPAVFIRPAVWMLATAWAPCLCASEARPSDRGFQASGIRPSAVTSTPSSGGRPLQRAGGLYLREYAPPAPAPPRLTSHRQVYPRAGRDESTRVEMVGDEKMCRGLILLEKRCGTSPFFPANGALLAPRRPSECLCLDPRVKPEDDDLLGVEEDILLRRCAMEAVEEDTVAPPRSVILGLDPRIQTQVRTAALSPPLRGRKRNRGIGTIRAKPQISQDRGSVRYSPTELCPSPGKSEV